MRGPSASRSFDDQVQECCRICSICSVCQGEDENRMTHEVGRSARASRWVKCLVALGWSVSCAVSWLFLQRRTFGLVDLDSVSGHSGRHYSRPPPAAPPKCVQRAVIVITVFSVLFKRALSSAPLHASGNLVTSCFSSAEPCSLTPCQSLCRWSVPSLAAARGRRAAEEADGLPRSSARRASGSEGTGQTRRRAEGSPVWP